jgi:ABC-type bacteriocin/lantibiotic exporter with double-glycine peptidase domain
MTTIPASGGNSQLNIRLENVPYYLQNDPQWGAETLGGTNERMAAAGCTVTCMAMGLSALGYPIDPLQLCKALKERSGFTENGLVVWNKVNEITNGKVKVDFPSLTHERIEAELQQNRPVIARIMLTDTITHWVLIVGKEGQEYLIIDPLNGAKTFLHLSDRTSKIYAIRVLTAA